MVNLEMNQRSYFTLFNQYFEADFLLKIQAQNTEFKNYSEKFQLWFQRWLCDGGVRINYLPAMILIPVNMDFKRQVIHPKPHFW